MWERWHSGVLWKCAIVYTYTVQEWDFGRFLWLFTLISSLHRPKKKISVLLTNNWLALSDYLTRSHITSFVWSVKRRPHGWVIPWWSARYQWRQPATRQWHKRLCSLKVSVFLLSDNVQLFNMWNLFASELQVRASCLCACKAWVVNTQQAHYQAKTATLHWRSL